MGLSTGVDGTTSSAKVLGSAFMDYGVVQSHNAKDLTYYMNSLWYIGVESILSNKICDELTIKEERKHLIKAITEHVQNQN